jgi:hypothetical protein
MKARWICLAKDCENWKEYEPGLVREKISAVIERTEMCVAKVKHKKQVLDVRCQMSVVASI